MKRRVTQRVREWLQHAKAVDELLEAVAEEMEKSSALERQLEDERDRCSSLEIELEGAQQALLSREDEINSLKRQVELLNEEYGAVLETYLLSYLGEHKGEMSIKECAKELKISEVRIKEALGALQKKGKIKLIP